MSTLMSTRLPNMKTNFVNQQEMVVLISRLGEAGVRKLVHELGTDVSNKLDAYLLAPKGAAQDTAELVWRVAAAGEVALHEALIAREDEIWAATSCAPPLCEQGCQTTTCSGQETGRNLPLTPL